MGNKINMRIFFFKKILFISAILFIQSVFIYIFYINEDLIFNFKISYLSKVYLPSYIQSIDNLKSKTNNYLAGLTSILNFDKNDSKIVSPVNSKHAKSIPVLLYHGILEKPDGSNVTIDNFREQMFALKKAGWQTLSIEDFYMFMRGEKELPEKSFLLTFDDGRKDSYYPVDPILSSLNYRATIFIITDRAFRGDNSFYLSKKELINMKKSGRWDIQVHTKIGHDFYNIDEFGVKGHFFSNRLWLDNEKRLETDDEFKKRIRDDFEGAKQDLRNKLGIDAIAFAFPFGDFGQRTINFSNAEDLERTVLMENKSVYKLAFYQIAPGIDSVYNYPTEMPYLIKRVNVGPEWTPYNLLEVLGESKK